MFLTFDLIEVKLQDRIVLPNVFFRDVNEEFQMYFIAYECQSPAIGHLTKQDRNPNIFENNSDLLKLVFFSICSICMYFCGKQNHISCEINFLWFFENGV